MDEQEPLLPSITGNDIPKPQDVDAEHLVDFDPSGDSENPLEWGTAYKIFIVFVLAFMAFTV